MSPALYTALFYPHRSDRGTGMTRSDGLDLTILRGYDEWHSILLLPPRSGQSHGYEVLLPYAAVFHVHFQASGQPEYRSSAPARRQFPHLSHGCAAASWFYRLPESPLPAVFPVPGFYRTAILTYGPDRQRGEPVQA